LSTLSL